MKQVKFYLEIINFIKFFKLRKTNRCFFVENKNIYNYLEDFIINSSHKILIISTYEINIKNKNISTIVYKSNFFLELSFYFLLSKYVYSSTPDLDHNLFKKSLFGNNKYIYLQHSNISLSIGYKNTAFINFDALQVINEYQYLDAVDIKNKFNLNIKIIKSKYKFLNKLTINTINNNKYDLLIAPTWNTNFYSTDIFFSLIDKLKYSKIYFIIRPHPMSIIKKEIDINSMKKNNIPVDDSSLFNFTNINYLLSDWSGIFIEYMLITKKRALFFETKKKILNVNYKTNFKSTPFEIFLREKYGLVFTVNEIDKFIEVISSKQKLSFDYNNFYKFFY